MGMRTRSNSVACRYFDYSIKVWMGSVLISPAVFFIILWVQIPYHSTTATAMIQFYLLFVAFELVFSLLTWLLFWMLTMVIAINVNSRIVQRWLVFVLGIALTVVTFLLFCPMIEPLQINSPSCGLMMINCFCIGCGTWLFYPARPQHLQPNNSKSNSDE